MGDYRVSKGDQYEGKPNAEIILGIPDDLSEKRTSEVSIAIVGDLKNDDITIFVWKFLSWIYGPWCVV